MKKIARTLAPLALAVAATAVAVPATPASASAGLDAGLAKRMAQKAVHKKAQRTSDLYTRQKDWKGHCTNRGSSYSGYFSCRFRVGSSCSGSARVSKTKFKAYRVRATCRNPYVD